MFRVRFVCLALALSCLLALGTGAMAAEVDCDATYCFTSLDFTPSEEPLTGICITDLPQDSGTVMLGTRVLQAGDILTADQITQMTFCPLSTQYDTQVCMSYLPIYANRVEPSATMTIAIRGKENQAPIAQDSSLETYKNLPNEGKLKANDPEGEALTFTLVRGPKRGDVTLMDDGTFTYTPKKNKVGVDSFTYTAADPAGNVSREATVTVQIVKPTDAKQYTDTIGRECRFEAEWMRNTGLFVGESVNGQSCFLPDKAVSRGEFLAMMVELLDVPIQDTPTASLPEETPDWLKPYLAAAQRAGITDRLPEDSFDADAPITGGEAAVMLQNALDLSITESALEAQQVMAEEASVPAWASTALTVMADNGLTLSAEEPLTRADVAEVLYQASLLSLEAPGTAVLRMQK